MFSWLRRKTASKPNTSPDNPGIGTTARVAGSNGLRSWTEEIHVINAAEKVLKQIGHAVQSHGTWLQHCDSGLVIQPQLVSCHFLEKGGAQTATTIEVRHPAFAPQEVLEYQHATGNDVMDSIGKGFEQWVQGDLVPLLDALREKPATCMVWELEFPSKDGKPARFRRAVLGPPAHLVQNPRQNENEEHPFCACCLLTHSFPAFKDLIEGDTFVGIRLFAMRNAEGDAEADCRVNGKDWPPGAAALREYVKTWPQAGFEFRKQYVVVQTVAKLTGANTGGS
jgi:hypothetical protein